MSLVVAGYPGEVNKVEFARMLRFFAYHAVEGLSLAPSGSNRGIEVTFDEAFAPGVYVTQTAPMVVNAPENVSGLPRRDRLILKHDWSANETTLEVKAGTPAASPSPPSVSLEPGTLFEQTLAFLDTASGQGAYSVDDIDQRGIPRQSPVVVVPFATSSPFSSEGVIRIDPDSGLLRYSDGSSSNRPLRARAADLDRRILKKSGTGAGNIGAGSESFYSNNNQVLTDVRQPGDPSWTGGGIHSAQFRVPVTGLWLIFARARLSRTNSNQQGRVNMRFRVNQTAQSPTSGGSHILNSFPFPVATTGPFTITGSIVAPLVAGSISSVTLENLSTHSIDRDNDGAGTSYDAIYLGPS